MIPVDGAYRPSGLRPHAEWARMHAWSFCGTLSLRESSACREWNQMRTPAGYALPHGLLRIGYGVIR